MQGLDRQQLARECERALQQLQRQRGEGRVVLDAGERRHPERRRGGELAELGDAPPRPSRAGAGNARAPVARAVASATESAAMRRSEAEATCASASRRLSKARAPAAAPESCRPRPSVPIATSTSGLSDRAASSRSSSRDARSTRLAKRAVQLRCRAECERVLNGDAPIGCVERAAGERGPDGAGRRALTVAAARIRHVCVKALRLPAGPAAATASSESATARSAASASASRVRDRERAHADAVRVRAQDGEPFVRREHDRGRVRRRPERLARHRRRARRIEGTARRR